MNQNEYNFRVPKNFSHTDHDRLDNCVETVVGYGSTIRILGKRDKYLKVEDLTMKTSTSAC